MTLFNKLNLHELDWGILNNEDQVHMRDYFIEETKNGIYTKFFDVEENDVVFDIGASVGPFTASILHKNPKQIHCFEPYPDLFNSLQNNFKENVNVVLNHAAFACTPEYTDSKIKLDNINTWDKGEYLVDRVKFSSYIEKNNIDKIDFLKTDCEGGEWSIFTEENCDWICNNVRKVSGEFHLDFKPEWVMRFILFREMYLKNAKNVHAFMLNDNFGISDYTKELWDDTVIIRNTKYINLSFEF